MFTALKLLPRSLLTSNLMLIGLCVLVLGKLTPAYAIEDLIWSQVSQTQIQNPASNNEEQARQSIGSDQDLLFLSADLPAQLLPQNQYAISQAHHAAYSPGLLVAHYNFYQSKLRLHAYRQHYYAKDNSQQNLDKATLLYAQITPGVLLSSTDQPIVKQKISNYNDASFQVDFQTAKYLASEAARHIKAQAIIMILPQITAQSYSSSSGGFFTRTVKYTQIVHNQPGYLIGLQTHNLHPSAMELLAQISQDSAICSNDQAQICATDEIAQSRYRFIPFNPAYQGLGASDYLFTIRRKKTSWTFAAFFSLVGVLGGVNLAFVYSLISWAQSQSGSFNPLNSQMSFGSAVVGDSQIKQMLQARANNYVHQRALAVVDTSAAIAPHSSSRSTRNLALGNCQVHHDCTNLANHSFLGLLPRAQEYSANNHALRYLHKKIWDEQ